MTAFDTWRMVSGKRDVKKIGRAWTYMLTKLAASGFVIFIFAALLLLTNKFDWFSVFGGMQEASLWNIVYFYGIPCSLFIDLLVLAVPSGKRVLEILLYIVFGYGYFLGFGFLRNVSHLTYSDNLSGLLFLGTFGAISAIFYYWGTEVGRNKRPFQYLMGLVIPILLLIGMIVVNDLKINWVESYGTSSYEASFDLFNGTKEIPVRVRKGQTLIFQINWDTHGGSSTGQYVARPNGDYAGMKEMTGGKAAVPIEEDGIYTIVAESAGGLKGSFKVTWEIAD